MTAIPDGLASFVSEVAETTNVPPDFPAAFALAVAAGSIGATHAVEVKKGHTQRASVYLCAVAQKGSGKTPALDAVARPVYDAQARMVKDGDKKKKAYVSDVTAEKLAELLHDNPRGVLMVRDELAGWLLSFNQYKAGGKGSDRQFYLSAWSGSPVSVDRKSKDSEPIYVRHPCLSVVGTIQPSVLDRFKSDSDDGFYDRVLFCYPDELPLTGELWGTVDPDREERWAEAVRDLRSLAMAKRDFDSLEYPRFLHLDLDARVIWQQWTEEVAAQVNGVDFDPALRGPAVKLSGYAARLALVSHFLRQVYGEDVPGEIDAEDMRRGADLARYFMGHAQRAWAAVGFTGPYVAARRLLNWIGDQNGRPFTRRDAHRALQRTFPTSDALTEPLRLLVQNAYIRVEAAQPGSTQDASGKRSTVVRYEINPEFCQQCQRCQHVNGVSASAPGPAGKP